MNNITKITKRDIFDLFNNGIKEDVFFEYRTILYPYYGRLEEIEFLERLYDLKSMRSNDPRFSNAKEDIWQHTINNDDYESNWVFKDERFALINGSDDKFLNFICEIFHPEVRDESINWRLYLDRVNKLLNYDNYEIYTSGYISGYDVFDWKIYSPKELYFVPFSIRNEKKISDKSIVITLSKTFRYQILQIFKEHDESLRFTDETNFNYWKSISELSIEELKKFYIPRNYENDEYIPASNFDSFINSTSPFSVLDIIEAYYYLLDKNDYSEDIYAKKVNFTLKHHDLGIKLADNGKIISTIDQLFLINSSKPAKEVGLQKLLKVAEDEYSKGEYDKAAEKLWDAFERLKTYYYPELDKKSSANKIIDELSSGNEKVSEVFKSEFEELTKIGNSFSIRHYERSQVVIEDMTHYKYFYKRCFALISTVLEKLE